MEGLLCDEGLQGMPKGAEHEAVHGSIHQQEQTRSEEIAPEVLGNCIGMQGQAQTAKFQCDGGPFGAVGESAVQQSQAYRQAVESQLVATIAESYYRLLMLDEQLAISERTLETWEENIKTLEALKRAGKTNEAAVLQAKANQLNVKGSMKELEQKIIETENSFSSLLGIVPMTIRRGHLNEQNFPLELSQGVPAQLLSRSIVMDLDEAEKFFGVEFKKKFFTL